MRKYVKFNELREMLQRNVINYQLEHNKSKPTLLYDFIPEKHNIVKVYVNNKGIWHNIYLKDFFKVSKCTYFDGSDYHCISPIFLHYKNEDNICSYRSIVYGTRGGTQIFHYECDKTLVKIDPKDIY